MKLGVLLVHGIGIQGPDWADGIIRGLRDAVAQALAHEAAIQNLPPADDMVAMEPAYWEDILRDREETLRSLLETGEKVNSGAVGQGVWRQLWHWFQRKEYAFITDYLEDIIGYLHPETQKAIQEELSSALSRLVGRIPTQNGPICLTLVSHSLGTVIASDYIWDTAKEKARQNQWLLENFFTVGSPLALFSLKFGSPEEFKKPIRVETEHGRWINIYDPDDPVGMPLRALNEAYAQSVHQDVRVDAGAYLVSHAHYFARSSTLRIVGRKLALDWLRLNWQLSQQEIASRYAAYDQWVKTIDG